MKTHRKAGTAALAGLALAATAAVSAPAQADKPPHPNVNTADQMARSIQVENVMKHLQEFERIAKDHDGNRAAGTSGYEATAQYVEKELRKAGFAPKRQYFDFFFESVNATSLNETSPEQRAWPNNPMSYAPSTGASGVTGELAAPQVATGCAISDYAGADLTGKIALVSRGTCSFAQKSQVAGQAGADAAIIYNNAPGALNGTLGGVSDANIPTTGMTQADGQALLAKMAQGPVTMTFILDKTMEMRQTFNIIADSSRGRADNVVMVGAHLDSVGSGPGINDNGSGSAGILETAIKLNKSKKYNNKVRFAWWGAEELGLIGSTHYVNDLVENNPAELKKIATYLNFDMIGSPNHIIGVYDADQSTHQAPVPVPPGSAETEQVFTDYFDKIDQPWVDTEFSGRSDYQAFILNGVPASGLFTGADGRKTAEEVRLFGGTEGELYDPNYHTPADDLTNINVDALRIMSKAVGYATMSLAIDTSAVNGKTNPRPGNGPKPKKVKPQIPHHLKAS
ncbi:M20/M25/M40 family metallo-hydrolase [Janibacter sp. GXQ6167]|uniref:M20/M25/M40 family metallo-hydrolase n=1 Tax=Janibacter sp. GXQ6167 TaxID=3240791 RepID=UPI003524A560